MKAPDPFEERPHDDRSPPPDGVPEASGAPSGRASRLRRCLGEPLLHFVLVGMVLIGAYGVLHPEPEPEASDQRLRIELTTDDLRQLAVMWLAQGRPTPTPDQMQSLVDQKVAEEILAREAVELGLDREDQIIKRRLAQKMDFLVADLAQLQPASPSELKAWFAENADRFAQPPHLSFRHLYFSFDERGPDGARDAAMAARGEIAGEAPDSPELASVADPFMFNNYYGDSTPDQMAKDFGPVFAKALFQLEPGSWQGPIESGYGWHLIWIDSSEPGRVPAFEEVEPAVKAAWVDERYQEIKKRAFDEMRTRYTVVVPPLDGLELVDLQVPEAPDLSPATQ